MSKNYVMTEEERIKHGNELLTKARVKVRALRILRHQLAQETEDVDAVFKGLDIKSRQVNEYRDNIYTARLQLDLIARLLQKTRKGAHRLLAVKQVAKIQLVEAEELVKELELESKKLVEESDS